MSTISLPFYLAFLPKAQHIFCAGSTKSGGGLALGIKTM